MIKKMVKYVDEEGFEYRFEPIEDTLKIKTIEKELCPKCRTELQHIIIRKEDVFGCPKCKKEIVRKNAIKEAGYEARYLIQEDDAISPEETRDDGLFLVGYHRDFTVDRGQRQLITIFKKEDFKKDNGYNGRVYADGYGWKSYAEAKKEGLIDKEVRRGQYVAGISQDLAVCIANNGKYEDGSVNEEAKEYIKKYHIFGLDAYIHSGITLSLSGEGIQCRWDTSRLGLVFVAKSEVKTRAKAEVLARSLIKEWNMYLSGDVYCLVKETYDKDKEYIDHDTLGGYYGYDDAVKALETEI